MNEKDKYLYKLANQEKPKPKNTINSRLFALSEKFGNIDTGEIVEFMLAALEQDEVMQQRFKSFIRERKSIKMEQNLQK